MASSIHVVVVVELAGFAQAEEGVVDALDKRVVLLEQQAPVLSRSSINGWELPDDDSALDLDCSEEQRRRQVDDEAVDLLRRKCLHRHRHWC